MVTFEMGPLTYRIRVEGVNSINRHIICCVQSQVVFKWRIYMKFSFKIIILLVLLAVLDAI